MRLTQCLRTQNIGWWFKQNWKRQSKIKIVKMRLPEQMAQMNCNIVDAQQYVQEEILEPPPVTRELPEMPWVVEPEPTGTNHPDWHERRCLFFTSETNLLAGEPHVQQLTKTVLFQKMPQALQQIYERLDVKHLEEASQSFIQNSLIHDGYQKVLPKIIDKERLWYTFARKWAIPHRRKCDLLVNAFLRMADIEATQRDARNIRREIILESEASCPLEKDGHLVQYRVGAPIILTTPTPLPPFATEEEVAATAELELPDIYPLDYILDLKSENVYKQLDFFPIAPRPKPHSIHTIFLYNAFDPDKWSRSQLLARAIGVCHGFAVAQARASFGYDVVKLPRPISLQCIQTDARVFDFIAYQLNTLDHSGTGGIKNCVWVDDTPQLFARCEKELFRNYFEGYDDDAVRKFMTFYLNGLKLN